MDTPIHKKSHYALRDAYRSAPSPEERAAYLQEMIVRLFETHILRISPKDLVS